MEVNCVTTTFSGCTCSQFQQKGRPKKLLCRLFWGVEPPYPLSTGLMSGVDKRWLDIDCKRATTTCIATALVCQPCWFPCLDFILVNVKSVDLPVWYCQMNAVWISGRHTNVMLYTETVFLLQIPIVFTKSVLNISGLCNSKVTLQLCIPYIVVASNVFSRTDCSVFITRCDRIPVCLSVWRVRMSVCDVGGLWSQVGNLGN